MITIFCMYFEGGCSTSSDCNKCNHLLCTLSCASEKGCPVPEHIRVTTGFCGDMQGVWVGSSSAPAD